jgi:transposase
LNSNSGRQRVNINGALNIDTFQVKVDFTDSINAASMKRLIKKLARSHPDASRINVILDNAGYCRSKDFTTYCEELGDKINLIFLPPYSTNLNLIERLWKFFKKM